MNFLFSAIINILGTAVSIVDEFLCKIIITIISFISLQNSSINIWGHILVLQLAFRGIWEVNFNCLTLRCILIKNQPLKQTNLYFV